jgi:hypothetical protein
MRIRPRSFWGHAAGHGWLKLLPVSVVYVHHDVMGAPGPNAGEEVEAAHMRDLDATAHGRGFAGISYNYGQAKSGRAYTGRGMHVGAQNDGENEESIGIVLFGNYENEPFTDKMADNLGKLIAELKYRRAIKRGVTIILGHRDTDATACPGKNAYRKLPMVRKRMRKHFRKMKRRR